MPAAVRVLLIEPHADTRELYDIVLTRAGWAVTAVADAAAARAAFSRTRPALVVSEIRLPERGSLETLRAFNEIVPVVVLTTSTVPTGEAGPWAAVLRKPLTLYEFLNAVRRALGGRPRR